MMSKDFKEHTEKLAQESLPTGHINILSDVHKCIVYTTALLRELTHLAVQITESQAHSTRVAWGPSGGGTGIAAWVGHLCSCELPSHSSPAFLPCMSLALS